MRAHVIYSEGNPDHVLTRLANALVEHLFGKAKGSR